MDPKSLCNHPPVSGYINQVCQEEENVLFLIAGDMLQGSIIDAEY